MSNFNRYCLIVSSATVNESYFILTLNIFGFSPDMEQSICSMLFSFQLILDTYSTSTSTQYSTITHLTRFFYSCCICKVTFYCPQLCYAYISFLTYTIILLSSAYINCYHLPLASEKKREMLEAGLVLNLWGFLFNCAICKVLCFFLNQCSFTSGLNIISSPAPFTLFV